MASDDDLMSREMTAMDGDAEMLVDEPTEPEQLTEFGEHTAQARDLSRKARGVEDLRHNSPGKQSVSQERDPSKQDPRENMPRLKGEATPSRGPIRLHERRPGAQDEGEDLAESKLEATPCRTHAAWVGEAFAACQANKKNLLNKGTVLITLDPTDPTKTCLLDANTLCNSSDVLKKLHEDAQSKSAGCVSQNALSAMLVLSYASASIPDLVAEALDATIESMLPPHPNARPPAETGRERSTRSAIAKIKAESDQGDSPPAARDEPQIPKTDWPKAYESFFCMVAGKKDGISKNDLSTALPQIQGVVEIAQKHNAIHAVQGAFGSLFFDYVGKDTFWKSISKETVSWIKIAIALRNRPVYDEAFKHLVGNGASFRNGIELDGVPDDVRPIIERRSRDLYLERRDIEDELPRMSIPATRRSARNPSPYESEFVSQHDEPAAYNTVNIFRDWMADHISHLRKETEGEIKPSYLCDHNTGCDSVAGFFRTINNQTYLYHDKVWKGFNARFKSRHVEKHQAEREVVKKSLEALKEKAADLVEGLSQSTLHFAENVDHLTCVEVEVDDVPWESDEDSDDDGSGSEEDQEMLGCQWSEQGNVLSIAVQFCMPVGRRG